MLRSEGKEERMKVSCLIEAIEAARENWEFSVGLVPKPQMEWKASPEAWSVKDIIGHVAWHELEMIDLIEARALVGSPWWKLPTDERNARIYQQYEAWPLDDVLTVAQDAYSRMSEAIHTLSDEDMDDPKQFEDMPTDWKPWRLIASNTYEHYLRHVGQVRKLAAQLEAT
jgi:hypothetical protein